MDGRKKDRKFNEGIITWVRNCCPYYTGETKKNVEIKIYENMLPGYQYISATCLDAHLFFCRRIVRTGKSQRFGTHFRVRNLRKLKCFTCKFYLNCGKNGSRSDLNLVNKESAQSFNLQILEDEIIFLDFSIVFNFFDQAQMTLLQVCYTKPITNFFVDCNRSAHIIK